MGFSGHWTHRFGLPVIGQKQSTIYSIGIDVTPVNDKEVNRRSYGVKEPKGEETTNQEESK